MWQTKKRDKNERKTLKRLFGKAKIALNQRSQTRGPREGPMRPANIRKNGDFKRNIGTIGLFSQKTLDINWKKISSF